MLYPLTAIGFEEKELRSDQDLGRSMSVAEPHRLRFSLSHFPGRRTSLKVSGRRTATRSCGDALYVNRSRSSATDAAASRRMISIMIGLRSIAVAARCVERPSLSCHCFLSRIRITACWRAVMRSGADLWNTAPGKKRRPCLRTRIVYPILPHSVVGRTGWTALNLGCPFSARRLLGLLTGRGVAMGARMKPAWCVG